MTSQPFWVRVAVVPTRSPVQALASVAVHDAARRFDDDVVAMAEAAAATRFAEVSVAQEQSLTSVGICEAGDVLGLYAHAVVLVDRDDRPPSAAAEAFDRAIDLRMTRLRRKIEHDPAHPAAIRTVRGVGYMFVPPKD